MSVKEEVYRGTRKRFEVFITDLSDTATGVDPDSCEVRFWKQGTSQGDSPRGPYTCSKVGETGEWGADVFLSETMTLGDWVAEFTWKIGRKIDRAKNIYTVADPVTPYQN